MQASLVVYVTLMSLHVARLTETFATQRTLIRFVSGVDSHVAV